MGRVIALSRPGAGHPPESVILHPARACRDVDPEVMFPEPGGPTGLAEARAVCRRCPLDIRDECLNWSIESDQRFGVFGGKSPAERRRLKVVVEPIAAPAASTRPTPKPRKTSETTAPAA